MAELAAYTNAPTFTTNLTAASVARGLRLVLDSSNTYSAAGIGVRGDMVASQTGAASESITSFAIQNGQIIPMLASEAITVNSTVYSAALGKVSQTSGGGAVIVGKANSAASGDGVLFEVLCENPL